MSELFDEDPRDAGPPARSGSRRSRALIITAVVLVIAFLGLSTFAGIYTDRLWYKSAGYGEVFGTLFWTKTVLFLVFGAGMALVVGLNIYLAYRFRPFFRPSSPEQNGLDRYREAVNPIRTWLLLGVALVLGLFAGSSAIGEWRDYLLWRNGVSFGSDDAFFHKDIGFYVFTLPWLHYLLNYAMAVLVVALIAAAVVHYLYGGIRLQTPRDRLSGAAQAQISLLLGLFVLAKAGDYWLDRFDLVSQGGGLITGMTYTDDNAVLPAKNILLGISVICAVLFFVNVWRRTWQLPSVGLALLAVSAILLGLIWPGIVQQFQVKPSEADKEASYIKANIEATRTAYDVSDVQVEKYTPSSSAASAELTQLANETSSVPLVDPLVVRDAFEQVQQSRAYYSVADVLDVDRYEIDGTDRALVLGVRELDQAGMNDGDKNWTNLHTVYTHGNGLIAAYANQRPEDNSSEINSVSGAGGSDQSGLVWAQGINAGEDGLRRAVGDYEDRIYYGEQSPTYSVVGKPAADAKDVELNLPTGGEDAGSTTTYEGPGDASVGGLFNQLMFATKFGEPNFLLSGRVNENSKVLFNRQPRERVEKVAPWLTVDSDPYPAIVNGRILWVVDGYTVTDRYPSSEKESFQTMTDDSLQDETGLRTLPTDEINYMRNAVKATVDAYTGEVTLYAWDDTDPILKAWSSAFPGTVKPKAEIPDELLQHLRYPKDLFQVQRYQFARYHVTDAGDFYQGNNRWEVPEDPYARGRFQPPYRLFTGDPETSDETFSLTSVYVPFNKNNLASFVSVDSDATDPDKYGAMRVLELSNDQTPGPGNVANEFTSDPDVADKVAQFSRSGATPIRGNLLTLPVNDGLMYVQPVYAKQELSESSWPILRYVLVKYGSQIGVGTTLRLALEDLVGTSGGTVTPPPDTGGDGGDGSGNTGGDGSINSRIQRLLDQADQAFQDAQAALDRGDLGAYQDQVKRAQDSVAAALRLAEQRDAGGSGSSDQEPSGSASPSESPSP
ncbi:UPF0182 family membrane protein [Nocardioides sp. T2.26MG-1]|uniref:UPF0182 family membrane protein n=1 Tax=Nocardioides sp. T2.26MG-1 TaxID=3041166 RepID=UPI002477A70F|nr:UPF0182 family protein [Nocardioides sp. T2.26MG-1]CAI9406658.1 hypothetical protein HIDPHFAB_04626 [Nocardioides sp. T2.26MG-1]